MLNLNKYPWTRSVSVRYSAIKNALKAGKKVVIYIYEKPDTSTFRYRAYNVMRASEKSDKWYAEYFFSDIEPKIILDVLRLCSELVLIRVQWSFFIERLIKEAKLQNKKVLFDCDDLVFDIESLPILMNTLGFQGRGDYLPDYIVWFSYVSRIELTASKCDGFITTNQYLGDVYQKKFGKDYKIIRNSLNNEQIEISNKCLCSEKSWDEFVIGYFSGSPSHTNDFLQVAPEVACFLERHVNSKLKVVGFMEFPPFMQKHIDNKQIEFQSLVDFIKLQELISSVHVNIVPLIDNKFTNCKSELKFFEGAIAGAITIATPTFTYKHAIQNNITGFLCQPGEWDTTLEKIYNQDIDYNGMISKARDYALKEYFGEVFLKEVENSFDYFLC